MAAGSGVNALNVGRFPAAMTILELAEVSPKLSVTVRFTVWLEAVFVLNVAVLPLGVTTVPTGCPQLYTSVSPGSISTAVAVSVILGSPMAYALSLSLAFCLLATKLDIVGRCPAETLLSAYPVKP